MKIIQRLGMAIIVRKLTEVDKAEEFPYDDYIPPMGINTETVFLSTNIELGRIYELGNCSSEL